MTQVDTVPDLDGYHERALMYPQQPQHQQPEQVKKKPRVLLIVLSAVFGMLILCVGAAVIVGLTKGDKPAGVDVQQPSNPPAPSSSEARPGVDVGAGTPGAPCSTDRLGKTFTKDGVTYTCKGPKPYRWQP